MGAAVTDLYETKISQVEGEFQKFLDVLRRENVQRFLEIGSRFGGSLWRIAQVIHPKATIVSCDSGKGMGGRKPGATDSLKACIDRLNREGRNAHLVVGDSQRADIISQVKKFAPFDAIFIDGDHELKGVTKDWENYGPMSRLVAFHDVGWVRPENYTNSKLVEVPTLWNELKAKYRSEEFIDYSTGATMGIGVLWRS